MSIETETGNIALAEMFFNRHFNELKRLSRKHNVKLTFNTFKKFTVALMSDVTLINIEGVDHYMHTYAYLDIVLSNLDSVAEEAVRLGLSATVGDFYTVMLSSIKSDLNLFPGLKFILEDILSGVESKSQPVMYMSKKLFIVGIKRSSPKLKYSVIMIPRHGDLPSTLNETPRYMDVSTDYVSERDWSCILNSVTLGGMKGTVKFDSEPLVVRAFIHIDTDSDNLNKGRIRVDIKGHLSIELRSNLLGDSSTLATFLLWRVLSRLSDDLVGYLNVKTNIELGTSRSAHFMLNSIKAKFAINQFTVCETNLHNQKDTKTTYVKPEYRVSQKDVAQLTSISLNFGTAIISTHAHLRYIERRIRVEGRFDPLSFNNFKNFLKENTWEQVTEEDRQAWDLSESDKHLTNRPNVRMFSTKGSDYVLALDLVSRYLVTVLVKGYTSNYTDGTHYIGK